LRLIDDSVSIFFDQVLTVLFNFSSFTEATANEWWESNKERVLAIVR